VFGRQKFRQHRLASPEIWQVCEERSTQTLRALTLLLMSAEPICIELMNSIELVREYEYLPRVDVPRNGQIW
jgi:hypothetical protein